MTAFNFLTTDHMAVQRLEIDSLSPIDPVTLKLTNTLFLTYKDEA